VSLRSALAGGRLVVRPLPELGATARLSADISTSGLGSVPKPITNLDDVANRFILSLGRQESPRVADWNMIAWCLWTTHPAVAEHDEALEAVLGRVARMNRRRPYRQLASAFFTDFSPERPRIVRVAGVLAAFASLAGQPWERLQTKYGIFDVSAGPLRLARAALDAGASIQTLLGSSGVSGALVEGGFAEAAHVEGLRTLSKLQIENATDRLKLIQLWCLRSDETLIFKNRRVEMGRAVVSPYGNRVPAAVDRDLILDFLVRQFGDPRVSPARWIGMDDVAEILKRWLTEQSLRQFFDVVDKIAPDGAWRYRRAFWQAYHDRGLIHNAWVVFGSDGALEAKRSFGPDARFGRFIAGGRKPIQQGHAVLLLDFEQCTVADWSYNGFCNIWPRSDRERPLHLNKLTYTSDEVRRSVPADRTESNLTRCDIFGHGGSESFVWQDRVARRLSELIGIRVPQSAYRVR
jgi:hypothetical protein